MKLTPKDDSPSYIQSLPAAINPNKDILVELAMLLRYGIITLFPFSKDPMLIVAQKNQMETPITIRL